MDFEAKYPDSSGSTSWTPSSSAIKAIVGDSTLGKRHRGIVSSVAADQKTAYGVRISDPWQGYVLGFNSISQDDLDDLFDFEEAVGAGSFVIKDDLTDGSWLTVMFDGEIDFKPDGNCTWAVTFPVRTVG